jgi:hypothetical protein
MGKSTPKQKIQNKKNGKIQNQDEKSEHKFSSNQSQVQEIQKIKSSREG